MNDTITISIEKYDELVKKANLFDVITELHEVDNYFMSDVLSNIVKAEKVLCAKIIVAPSKAEPQEEPEIYSL